VENDIAMLQYADIFLSNEGFEVSRNLEFILCLFEQMSGLTFKFAKSEVFCLAKYDEYRHIYE
jgi:hypothetical protein